jgi:PAS domain-containing protein
MNRMETNAAIDRPDTRDSHGDAYRVAFLAHPAVGLVTDGRAVIADANRSAVAFFNVQRRALVGKPLLFFVARRDTRAFREHVRSLPQRLSGSLVVQLRPRGGTPRPMRLTFEPAQGSLLWLAVPEEGGARDDTTPSWVRSAGRGPAGGFALECLHAP